MTFTPLTYVLAVQRELQEYRGDEGNFDYSVFKRPIPLTVPDEPLCMTVRNEIPVIRVNEVKIHSVSFSSMLQVGSNRYMEMESRTKHIRQLLPKTRQLVAEQEAGYGEYVSEGPYLPSAIGGAYPLEAPPS